MAHNLSNCHTYKGCSQLFDFRPIRNFCKKFQASSKIIRPWKVRWSEEKSVGLDLLAVFTLAYFNSVKFPVSAKCYWLSLLLLKTSRPNAYSKTYWNFFCSTDCLLEYNLFDQHTFETINRQTTSGGSRNVLSGKIGWGGGGLHERIQVYTLTKVQIV